METRTTKVDMSPEAITRRMIMLDQLWELSRTLKSSRMVGDVEPRDFSAKPVATDDDDSE